MITVWHITKFHLRSILSMGWLWVTILGSTLFIVFFGREAFASEHSGLPFVIAFNHVNMIFPLLVLSFSFRFINNASHGGISGLLDSYSHKNIEMFSGLILGLLLSFWFLALIQFGLIAILKFVYFPRMIYSGLDSFFWFFPLSLLNVLLLVSLAALLGVICKEVLFGYTLIFVYQMLNLLFDNFNPSYLSWFATLHTSGFKYHNYSAFGMFDLDAALFFLSRAGIPLIASVVLLLGYMLYKRYRQKPNMYLWPVIICLFGFLFFYISFHGKIAHKPVQAIGEIAQKANFQPINLHIEDYNIKGIHEGDSIHLQVDFLLVNETEQDLFLQFYLGDSLIVKSLSYNGENLAFERMGNMVTTGQIVKPGVRAICHLEYGGTMVEYVKVQDSFWDRRHSLYAYIGPDLIFVPACAGWYPTTTPLYNFNLEKDWLYPARVPNNQNIVCDIEGKFPILSDENMLYGYPELQITILDDIEYIHGDFHEKSIRKLHQLIGDKLIFLNQLMPVETVRLLEVPQNTLFAEFTLENGNGRILLGENTILNRTVHENLNFYLERALFSGWFNLGNLGFEYMGLVPQGGYPITILPGNSFGTADANVLYIFYQYIYNIETNSDFDLDSRHDFLVKAKAGLPLPWSQALDGMITYYECKGLPGATELFRYAFSLELNNNLSKDSLVDYLDGERNNVL